MFRSNFLNFFCFISILLLFFGGVNVLRSLGYMIGTEEGPIIQKLFPSFIIMLFIVFSLLITISSRKLFLNNKIDIQFLLFLLILILYMNFNGLTGGVSFIPNTLILPIFYSLYLPLKLNNKKYVLILKNFIIYFFVINSTISIIENILSIHLFSPLVETTDYSGFRSTALQNHPLNNAFITAIIMLFILTSEMKLMKKYLFYFLGFISIISFGSRSSVVICSIVFILYNIRFLFFNLSNSKTIKFQKIVIIFVLIIAFFGFSFLIINTSIAERLVNTAYFDDSASVRLDVFNIFEIIDSDKLLWGSSDEQTESIRDRAGVFQIENFWVIWILRFGLVFAVGLIYYFISFLYKHLFHLRRFDKFLVLFTFLGIASTNNSLGTITGALSFFVVCSFVFSKYNFNNKKNSLQVFK